MRTSAWLGVAVMLLGVASCAEDPQRPRVSGVTTRVVVSSDSVEVGEGFGILVRVKNNGVVEVVAECEVPLGYRVRAADGTVALESDACAATGDTLRLGYDDQVSTDFSPTAWLVPGRYEVEAGLVGHEDEYPWARAALEVVVPAGTFAAWGTIAIDSCVSTPPEYDDPIKVLVGGSTGFVVLFDSVTAVENSELIVSDDLRIRYSNVTGHGSRWIFTNPVYTNVWADRFAGRSLTLSAGQTVWLDGREPGVGVLDITTGGDPGFPPEQFTWAVGGEHDLVLDADGFPVLENDSHVMGECQASHAVFDPPDGFSAFVRGPADIFVKNALSGAP